MNSLPKVAFSVLTQCSLFKNEFFTLQKSHVVVVFFFFSEFYPIWPFLELSFFTTMLLGRALENQQLQCNRFLWWQLQGIAENQRSWVYILEYMVQDNFKGTKCSSCDRLDQTQAWFCEEGFPFEALSIFNPHSYLQNPVLRGIEDVQDRPQMSR